LAVRSSFLFDDYSVISNGNRKNMRVLRACEGVVCDRNFHCSCRCWHLHYDDDYRI